MDRAVVVDDNSPDGTSQIADGLAEQRRGRVDVIHRAGKLGLGTAYIAGFRRALDQGVTRVLRWMPISHTTPATSPRCCASAENCDLVIGSRYVPGGGSRNWGPCAGPSAGGPTRWRTSTWGCTRTIVLRVFAVIADLLQDIDLDAIRSNGYSFLIEMLFLCQQMGASVGDVPIIFADRRGGRSKILGAEIAKAWQTIARLSVRRLPGWSPPIDQAAEAVVGNQHGLIMKRNQLLVILAAALVVVSLQACSNRPQAKTYEGYINDSLALYNAGDYQKSLEAAQNAVAMQPNSAVAYNNICAAYNELKQFDKAIEHARRRWRSPRISSWPRITCGRRRFRLSRRTPGICWRARTSACGRSGVYQSFGPLALLAQRGAATTAAGRRAEAAA